MTWELYSVLSAFAAGLVLGVLVAIILLILGADAMERRRTPR